MRVKLTYRDNALGGRSWTASIAGREGSGGRQGIALRNLKTILEIEALAEMFGDAVEGKTPTLADAGPDGEAP